MNESADLNSNLYPANKPRVSSGLLDRMSGWRKVKDQLANFTITVGGMGVLFSILLIFFYLFYEIMPVFESAEIEEVSSYSLQGAAVAGDLLYLGMEEQAEIALQINTQGKVLFFKAQSGEVVKQLQLPAGNDISSFALNSEQQPLMALGYTDGTVQLPKPEYKLSYPNDQRLITPNIVYPYGDISMQLANAPIEQLAVRDSEEQLVVVAVVNQQLVGKRLVKGEDFLSEEITLEEEPINFPDVAIDIDKLLIGPDQRWLYVFSDDGRYTVINLYDEEIVDRGNLLAAGTLSDVQFLLGGISILVSSDQGEITQWFMVRGDNAPPRLQKIRTFEGNAAVKQIAGEHRRKGFITLNSVNELDVYYTTSHRRLLSKTLAAEAVSRIAIAPRANALLVKLGSGQYSYWQLYNEHPEVSWSVLWDKVWYESYSEPDYIWQSSAADNDFEPKYSFSPLAFGTLKAAFYAMIIAAPLALCGAIYTAYFMSPIMRRKVKPLIELMEALPTVILGFLAGLWLAPFLESHLPGIFSVLIMLPVSVLFFGFFWSRLPASIRLQVPDGWHAALLIPVVIGTVWACFAASSTVELLFFDGDMRSWLTNDLGISFDQRNAMVVGIAMGFAVVPTIFSIAEDAIFSVPKHLSYGSLALGATPWQTLVGVIIPTASPGIFSALMIGMGRAVGETMIVLMATGNTPIMDVNIFEGMRTLAANIAVEIGETEVDSSHFRVLFLAAFVLFMFTFVVNTVAEIVRHRLRKQYGSL